MFASGPDYVLDVTGLENPADLGVTAARSRRWIGVRFDCCGVYQRLYRSQDGKVYRGRCPKCLRHVQVRVGPEGTDTRFFTAQ